MEQNWTNPFLGDDGYTFIHAGSGCCNTTFPDGVESPGPDLEFNLGLSHLFDWTTDTTSINRWFDLLRSNPNHKSKLVIDCGAYSLWSIGKTFDMDKYINWLNTDDRLDLLYWAVAVDKISGTPKEPVVSQEESEQDCEETWSNYLRMIQEVKWPKKLLPVFHQGDDFKYLDRMLEYILPDGDHIPYICVANHGGNINEAIAWMDEVFRRIYTSSNPNVKVHLLGQASPRVLARYRVQTSDASSAIRQAAFGTIDYKGNMISIGRTIDQRYIDFQPQYVKDGIQKQLDRIGHGLTLKHLGEHHNYAKILSMLLKSDHLEGIQKEKCFGKPVKKVSLW